MRRREFVGGLAGAAAQWPHGPDLLIRLVCDPQMARVWRELLRRKRRDYRETDDFVYPASLAGLQEIRREVPNFTDSKALQNFAIARFFEWAFYRALTPNPALSLRELGSDRNKLSDGIKLLQDCARKLRALGLSPRHIEQLEAVIATWKKTPPTRFYVTALTVKTKPRSDRTLLGYVRLLSAVADLLFRNRLYGTVATVAGVAFQRTVTADQVREMVGRSRPGAKRPG